MFSCFGKKNCSSQRFQSTNSHIYHTPRQTKNSMNSTMKKGDSPTSKKGVSPTSKKGDSPTSKKGDSPTSKKGDDFSFKSPVAFPPKLQERKVLQRYDTEKAVPVSKNGYNPSDRYADLFRGDDKKIGGFRRHRRITKKLKSKPTGNISTVVS